MKVALCGAWHVHAKDYAKHATEHGEIVGIYEENEALRKEFLEKFPVPVFETLDELLASDAEGIIVSSASNEHADHMVKIANAKKHIFTEKVLALTDEDCARVKEAVERNGVRFVISLFQKSVASRRTVKAVVDSGELGKINYVRFRNCHSGSTRNWLPTHFYNREQCGGGAMIDLGAHGMYLIHWLLGMPETFRSTFTVACENPEVLEKNPDRVEDNAVTVMSFGTGAIAINETGFVSNYSPVVLEVFGETGYVRMTGDSVVKRIPGGGAEVEVPLVEKEPLPIVQFLTNDIREGYGIDEACFLTHMMVKAYE